MQQAFIDPAIILVDPTESLLPISIPENITVDRSIQTIVRKIVDRLVDWDISTYLHSIRLIPWAVHIAQIAGLTPCGIQDIAWAALLHDIGKIMIPHEILEKAGPLTEDQWAIMRRHPVTGANMLDGNPQLSAVREMILNHHEKVDGSGYPAGLKGEQVSLGARIIALIDAYGAMTEPRLYSRMLTQEEAINEIRRCSGTHFDPRLAEIFIEIVLSRNNLSLLTH